MISIFMYRNIIVSSYKNSSRVCMITAWKLPHYHCAYTLASRLTQNKQLPLAQARPTMLAFTSTLENAASPGCILKIKLPFHSDVSEEPPHFKSVQDPLDRVSSCLKCSIGIVGNHQTRSCSPSSEMLEPLEKCKGRHILYQIKVDSSS